MCQAVVDCINLIDKPEDIIISLFDNHILLNNENITIDFQFILNNENLKISPISFPLANHILRITKKILNFDNNLNINSLSFNINYLYDVLNCIIKIISSGIYKYCTICSLEILSNTIACCANCFDEFCYTIADNYIHENYNKDPLTVLFLIKIAIECLKSQKRDKIFNPFPKKYETNNTRDFKKLLQITSNYSEKVFKEIFNNYSNELDISNKLGQDLYGFIKFILITNKTYIISEKISNNDKIYSEDHKNNLEINDETKFINFQVIHNPKIENKFKTSKPQYLFHGSAIGNWYSIMRNGLKNYSGTKMMANGMAYGAGIYLSDQVNLSLGYSRSGAINDQLYVISVLQIIDDIQQYKKSGNIYVIPDENKILLRYLILTNGKNINTIQKYFMVDRMKEISLYNRNISLIILKRLKQEIKYIEMFAKNNDQLKNFKINVNNLKLQIDIDDFQIEFNIPENYPTDPPFIRIVKPRIKNCIFINEFGVVNLPELSIKRWNTKIKLAELIIKIYDIIKSNDRQEGEYDYEKAYDNYCEFFNK